MPNSPNVWQRSTKARGAAFRDTGGPVPGLTAGASARGRILAVDIARSVALAGMILFHGVTDLELFGHLPPGTSTSGGWAVFARVVAGSFLFLVGVSLVLAHRDGIRWPAVAGRIARIAAAAALITAVTWAAMPERFVFFGILHSIALASLLGLAFLRLPWIVALAAALAVAVLPQVLRSPLFDPPALVWTGLAVRVPVSMDFVPVFPWFGATLAGIAAAGLAGRAGLWDRLRHGAANRSATARLLSWPGRHSLAIYLLHQPVLIAAIWGVGRLA